MIYVPGDYPFLEVKSFQEAFQAVGFVLATEDGVPFMGTMLPSPMDSCQLSLKIYHGPSDRFWTGRYVAEFSSPFDYVQVHFLRSIRPYLERKNIFMNELKGNIITFTWSGFVPSLGDFTELNRQSGLARRYVVEAIDAIDLLRGRSYVNTRLQMLRLTIQRFTLLPSA